MREQSKIEYAYEQLSLKSEEKYPEEKVKVKPQASVGGLTVCADLDWGPSTPMYVHVHSLNPWQLKVSTIMLFPHMTCFTARRTWPDSPELSSHSPSPPPSSAPRRPLPRPPSVGPTAYPRSAGPIPHGPVKFYDPPPPTNLFPGAANTYPHAMSYDLVVFRSLGGPFLHLLIQAAAVSW